MRLLRLQRGASLLEALIAFAVLSLGLSGMARLQTHLRLDAEIARQRSEAVRLAQQDIETLRSFSALGAADHQRAYADIAPAQQPVSLATTRYELTRRVADAAGYKATGVTLAWADRRGQPHSVVLESMIAGSDPLLAASLTVVRRVHPMRGAAGRAPGVPLGAKDLGDGRSVLKPQATGNLAFVFSNLSGQIVGRCDAVAPATSTRDLTSADIAGCDTVSALLLSGVVRVSATQPPDPAHANDAPLGLRIELALTGGPYPAAPQCASEAQTLGSGERFVGSRVACMQRQNHVRWISQLNSLGAAFGKLDEVGPT